MPSPQPANTTHRSRTLVAPTLVGLASAVLRARQIPVEPLLIEAGLPSNADLDRERLVPMDACLRFYALASDAAFDPALGITATRQAATSDLGLLGYILQISPTPRHALERCRDFVNTVWTDESFVLDADGNQFGFAVDLGPRRTGTDLLTQELLTAFVLHTARLLPRAPRVLSATLRDPNPPDAWREVLGVVPRGGATVDRLVLHRPDIEQKNPHANPGLLDHLELALSAQIDRRRNAQSSPTDLLRLVGCTVDLRAGTVHRPHSTVTLTTKERDLLGHLARQANRVVGRDELEREVWSLGKSVITHAPAVAVRRLRQKIEPDPQRPINLITVFGEGWKLVVDDPPG